MPAGRPKGVRNKESYYKSWKQIMTRTKIDKDNNPAFIEFIELLN